LRQKSKGNKPHSVGKKPRSRPPGSASTAAAASRAFRHPRPPIAGSAAAAAARTRPARLRMVLASVDNEEARWTGRRGVRRRLPLLEGRRE